MSQDRRTMSVIYKTISENAKIIANTDAQAFVVDQGTEAGDAVGGQRAVALCRRQIGAARRTETLAALVCAHAGQTADARRRRTRCRVE